MSKTPTGDVTCNYFDIYCSMPRMLALSGWQQVWQACTRLKAMFQQQQLPILCELDVIYT
jgi:hypothetical protein